mmetsp:Transcript_6069/g.9166  ORF Transcript_6069/g.9166 Transcript_6069/m.9166 type:complete len:111 (+) Transcript_6069:44-376(+)
MQQPVSEEDANRVSVENLQQNMKQVDIARTFICIIGGIVAGVLGHTGLQGLISFVIVYAAVAFALSLKMGFDFKQYMNCSVISFLVSDLQKNGLSFILFWTMTYALVYIY